MSWDRTEYTETAVCACGKGKIVRRAYIEEDDWNRTQSGIISEEICCAECKDKFHIEHYVQHRFCPSWKGDNIVDRTYLVPNNVTIPATLSEENFNFSIDEQIVATYLLEEIAAAREDMIRNKYSTRLERKSSQDIVALYAKKYKKRSLAPIVKLLENIKNQYDRYEWTSQQFEEFRNNEKTKIQENKQAISDALRESFELDFRRTLHDESA